MADPQKLYQQAVQAAKAGNRVEARELLEQVVEEDEQNVRAWLALARLTDNLNEKRICLTTVLQLDPNNATAKKLLDKVDERLGSQVVDEVVPGVSRRLFRMLAGGLVAFILLVLIIVVLIINNNNSKKAENEENTAVAQQALTEAVQQPTNRAMTSTAESIAQTETQIALASPTPTITPTNPYIAPTFTPTVTPSPTPTVAPPVGLSGHLYGWSGSDVINVGYMPIVEYNLNGGEPVPLGDRLSRYPTTTDGQVFLHMHYIRSQFDALMELWTPLSGEEVRLPVQVTGGDIVFDPDMVYLAPDGTFAVFTARPRSVETRQIYLARFNVATPADVPPDATTESGETQAQTSSQSGITIEQLTNDESVYSFPIISPNGLEVVAIRDSLRLTDGVVGTDLVRIDIATRNITLLTTDGDAIIETVPHWAPDNQQIAYAWIPEQSEDNPNPVYNINIIGREGTPNFTVINNPEANDSYPVFSPDGNYIAFTSDQFGQVDLFVLDRQGQQIFQMTNSRNEDYAWTWLP